MHRVKNWTEYKDNWADLSECIWVGLIDIALGVCIVGWCLCCTISAALGFSPDVGEDE